MAKLQELRTAAKKAGIAADQIRGASASELEELISTAGANGSEAKPVAKKAVHKAVAKKSTVKKSASKKSGPVKSQSRGTTKRRATRKASGSGSAYVPKGGRNVLAKINYSQTDGWNPRAGSTRDRIVKLLRKYKGNRTKVFDALLPDIGDFVATRKQNGQKWGKTVRGKSERQNMLKYVIARTDWDFAKQTGQHKTAKNRVKYGTGGTGAGVFKRKTKTAAKATPARKSTRKPAAAKKGAQRRTKVTKTRPTSTRRRTTRRKAR